MATRSRAFTLFPVQMALGTLLCLAPKLAHSQVAPAPAPTGRQNAAQPNPSATIAPGVSAPAQAAAPAPSPNTTAPGGSAPTEVAPPTSGASALPPTAGPDNNGVASPQTPKGQASSPTAEAQAQSAAPSIVQPVATPAESLPTAPVTNCKQEPMRDGFYLRAITGIGYARLSGSGPYGSTSITGMGEHSTLAIGGGIIRGLALAGTMQATTTTARFKQGPLDDAQVTSRGTTVAGSKKATGIQAQLGALVDYYPDPMSGFHVGLSAGLGAISVAHQATDQTWGGVSFSGSLLAGYDFALSRSWGLGAVLVATGTSSGELKDSDNKSTGYKLSGFAIEVGSSLLYF